MTAAGRGVPLAHIRFETVWHQHDLAPSGGDDVIDHAGASCPLQRPMIIVRTAESAEQALTVESGDRL